MHGPANSNLAAQRSRTCGDGPGRPAEKGKESTQAGPFGQQLCFGRKRLSFSSETLVSSLLRRAATSPLSRHLRLPREIELASGVLETGGDGDRASGGGELHGGGPRGPQPLQPRHP